MFVAWKNKGLLVIAYLIASCFGVAMISGALSRNFGGIFLKVDNYTTFGLGFLIAAVWTYLTKDDYYTDKNGNKQKMEIPNELYFIRMEIWAYILFGGALIFLG